MAPVTRRLPPKHKPIPLEVLTERTRTFKGAVRFLQEHNILHKSRQCKKGHQMALAFRPSTARWRCSRQGCRVEISVLTDTFLSGCKLPLKNVIKYIYHWSMGDRQEKAAWYSGIGASHSAAVWRKKLRALCTIHNKTLLPLPEGGTVEVDEIDLDGNIVLGVQWRLTNHVYLQCISQKTQKTIYPILKRVIAPGAEIHTDGLAVYKALDKQRGYNWTHLVVNHCRNFKDPVTGACTNRTEAFNRILRDNYSKNSELDGIEGYLEEQMFRRNSNPEPVFNTILQAIADITDITFKNI